MDLDNGQLQTLKSWLVNNAGNLNDQQAAEALNQTASPDFYVFRTTVTTDEARKSLVWSEVLDGANGLDARARWAFDTITATGEFDASDPNTRSGLATIFKGANYAQTRQAILQDATRRATVGEKVLSSAGTGPGGGDGSAMALSAVMGDGAEGAVTVQDVVDARQI